MRLARFRNDHRPRWGFVQDDQIRAAPPGAPDLLEALSAGSLADLLGRSDAPVPLAAVRLLAPVARPGKVICVGLNYRAHAEESGIAIPADPMVFLKFPSAVTGPHDDIVLPSESDQVDWEVELAVVIGARIDRALPSAPMRGVAGFAVANDVSARDLQAADGQWVRAKSFRSFCPLGPWLTTTDEVGDGSGLDISLSVNGVTKQCSSTADLIADVPTILRHVSAVGPLDPGDVILTGTPAGTGIGMRPPEFLAPGDVVRARIAGLGELVNRVVAAHDPAEVRP